MPSPAKSFALTFMIWSVITILYAVFIIWHILSGPPSPEIYTNSLGFQIFNFLYGRFPSLVVLLLIVLVIQWFMFLLPRAQLAVEHRVLLSATLGLCVVVALVIGIFRVVLMARHLLGDPWTFSVEYQVLRFLGHDLPLIALVSCLPLGGGYFLFRKLDGRHAQRSDAGSRDAS